MKSEYNMQNAINWKLTVAWTGIEMQCSLKGNRYRYRVFYMEDAKGMLGGDGRGSDGWRNAFSFGTWSYKIWNGIELCTI